ncbi:hypothetical protein CYY_006553 [Polysphondylium violaceum]|uniref:Uncharacterized protein n=1 Tax=Polysphondylium violaceum TaxID=133409 RepID=A0A8J4V5V3_9MYCE|nr:hypothetical protein CYY_006553 [Polysphondylium violaceum]
MESKVNNLKINTSLVNNNNNNNDIHIGTIENKNISPLSSPKSAREPISPRYANLLKNKDIHHKLRHKRYFDSADWVLNGGNIPTTEEDETLLNAAFYPNKMMTEAST